MVQWLGLHASTAGGTGSGEQDPACHAARPKKRKKKKKESSGEVREDRRWNGGRRVRKFLCVPSLSLFPLKSNVPFWWCIVLNTKSIR